MANAPKPPSAAAIAIGRRIREAAEAEAERSGRTLKAIAKDIGVEPHTLDRYMSGKTNPQRRLWDISRVVRRSVEWLRGDEDASEMDATQRLIEGYVTRKKLAPHEARVVRATSHYRVTEALLDDLLDDLRNGMSAQEAIGTAAVTEEKRAKARERGMPRMPR